MYPECSLNVYQMSSELSFMSPEILKNILRMHHECTKSVNVSEMGQNSKKSLYLLCIPLCSIWKLLIIVIIITWPFSKQELSLAMIYTCTGQLLDLDMANQEKHFSQAQHQLKVNSIFPHIFHISNQPIIKKA